MGRKVHPIGYRLKIVKEWEGRWFATGTMYREQLSQDIAIRKLILEGRRRAAISRVEIERYPNQVHVTIFSGKPGIVIGRKGAQVKEIRTDLEKLCGVACKVEVEEITQPDLEAKLVAENVANQLERRISYSRAMKRAIGQAMRQGAKGIKISVAGRLGGWDMSRRTWMREGRVPLQTLRADIDYALSEAATTYGKIGVKVWIYRGEVLPDQVGDTSDVYVSS
ncbi:MAG: 30S ribosomal protein S3 [Anaerolineaceae bacterium]|nr:30S ribosomal protein S3 [Anaerolineaceae bacterium]